MAVRSFSFTSESVTEGHPDKIADQISDAVLDDVIANDAGGRCACETLITTGLVVVAGEISTEHYVDVRRIVRETITDIGYTRAKYGFDAETCGVVVAIDEQSPDIAQGVDESYEVQHGDSDPLDRIGAGDQGMMFGYASNETAELMPLPIVLAHRICKRISEVRKADVLPYLRPDGKAQVTVRYEVDEQGRQSPVEIERVLVSTQHRDGLDTEALIKPDLIEHVLRPILPHALYDEKRLDERDFVYVNPTGKFVIGGPMGDTGLTGRKIIVDTYGGAAPHGGGAFSGKDPTKVDRSAAYAARWVAKNVVAAGLAERCQIQVAYAIGVAHPVSVLVECFGTEAVPQARIEELVHAGVRPASGGDPPRPRPPPADLPQDGRVRPLRPRRQGLHLGAHRPRGGPSRRRRPRRRQRIAPGSPEVPLPEVTLSTRSRHAFVAGRVLVPARAVSETGRPATALRAARRLRHEPDVETRCGLVADRAVATAERDLELPRRGLALLHCDPDARHEALVVEPVQQLPVVLGEADDLRALARLKIGERRELTVLGLLEGRVDGPAVGAPIGHAEPLLDPLDHVLAETCRRARPRGRAPRRPCSP